jgi:hypothetical protein
MRQVNHIVYCFDDFDETNVYPEDFYEWWKRGAELREFDCPGMRKAVSVQSPRLKLLARSTAATKREGSRLPRDFSRQLFCE